MKAFIYLGGGIYDGMPMETPARDDLVIAADSGYQNAARLGVTPDIAVGDFDSLHMDVADGVETMQVPAEKDFTDTQLAVETAMRKGATELVIIGGLDGRLDHTLSNLAILEDLSEKGVFAYITNGQNRVRYLNSTSTLLPRSGYRYLSLLTLSEKAKGVSVEGCKYPLKNVTLTRSFQYAVSNEITGNCALVSVRKGGIYIVESKDT